VFGLFTNVTLAQQMEFIKGADGSVLDEVGQSGGKYFDNGEEKNALKQRCLSAAVEKQLSTAFRNNPFDSGRRFLFNPNLPVIIVLFSVLSPYLVCQQVTSRLLIQSVS